MPLFFDCELSNIFDYLQINKAVISAENKIEEKSIERLSEIEQYYQARLQTIKESKLNGSIYNPIPSTKLYLDKNILNQYLRDNILIRFDNFENKYFQRSLDLGFKLTPNFFLASKSNKCSTFKLIDQFISSNAIKSRILISCNSIGSANRLQKILLNNEINSEVVFNYDQLYSLKKNIIALLVFNIDNGFYNDDILIISENLILEKEKLLKNQKNCIWPD